MKRTTELLFIVALGGCTRASVVEAPMISVDAGATPLVASEGAAPANPLTPRPGYRFAGSYICAQGSTKLTIVIDEVGSGSAEVPVEARFEFLFEGGDGDSDPAQGAYRMRGKFDPKTRRLNLDPEAWIVEPANYEMVGIRGTIGRSGDTFAGTVHGPDCTTFETKLDPATAGR